MQKLKCYIKFILLCGVILTITSPFAYCAMNDLPCSALQGHTCTKEDEGVTKVVCNGPCSGKVFMRWNYYIDCKNGHWGEPYDATASKLDFNC
jgi:hypothetical protein